MDRIKALLGLAPDASEDAIAEAISALQAKLKEAEDSAAEREAEAFANENAAVADKAALKNAYLAAPDEARALVNAFKAANAKPPLEDEGNIPAKPLLNSVAKTPDLPAAKDPLAMRSLLASLAPKERAAFFKEHEKEF